MTKINVLNEKFETTKELSFTVELTPEVISVPCVHQVVKATLAGRRQGNACTKNKSQVSGGGAKPFKQKGTGRARQGSSRSPLMPGGGTVFGPMPRSYEQKLNKKVVLRAIQSVVADKLNAGKLIVIDTLKSDGKTKSMNEFLKSHNISSALIVTESSESLALRAARNIATVKALPHTAFSVYEAVKYTNLVIESAALSSIVSKLENV